MNKTGIEWVRNPDGSQGYTLNSKTGCENHTPEGLCLGGLFPCYAFRLAHGRLWKRYVANHHLAPPDGQLSPEVIERSFLDPFYPRWWPERLAQISKLKKPTGIFLDDMSDWMGDYWPREWTMAELQMMRENPQHRFYTLTKQAQRLPEFSPFPDNCFVGVTSTNQTMFYHAVYHLQDIEAKVKFISFEPLLQGFNTDLQWEVRFLYWLKRAGINWLIIGACTGTLPEMVSLCDKYPELAIMRYGNKLTAQPRIEDLREIVEAADKAGVKVFLKDNLDTLLRTTDGQIPTGLCDNYGHTLRQEMPEIK